jgi:peptidoglycan/xylan/chitin deacetylase (PgdA/CDA1 family)
MIMMKALATTAVAAAGSAAFLAWAVRGRSAAVFGPSIWRGPTDRPVISLTFDDGPSEGTPAILEVLGQYRVPATFFQVGANVDRLPEIAAAVHDAGHEIGNHSYSHPLLCFRSQNFMESDLRRAQEAIGRHTGVVPTWFRAPYGVRWFGLAEAQRRLGLGGVMWTVIGYDWSLGAEEVVERIFRRVSKGAILCLHDGRELQAKPDTGATLEAVRRLVPKLLDQGYRFETLSRLLCPTI